MSQADTSEPGSDVSRRDTFAQRCRGLRGAGCNLGRMRRVVVTGLGAVTPGIGGRSIASIKDPARTILVAEVPAFFPYSWHHSSIPGGVTLPGGVVLYNGAKNMVSFVDGHVDYVRIYWNSISTFGIYTLAMQYDPPAGYDYKWSGD